MRKKLLPIISIFFFTFIIATPGFSSQRETWWQIRHSKLIKENNYLKNKSYYYLIKPLMEKEIKHAKDTLKIFNAYSQGYSQLGENDKYINISSVQRESEKKIQAVFNIVYLNAFLNNTNYQYWYNIGNKTLREKTETLLKSKFPESDQAFISNFLNSNSENHHYKYFANELYYQYMIEQYTTRLDSAKTDIFKNISQKISENNNQMKNFEVETLIDTEINTYFKNYKLRTTLKNEKPDIDESWVWDTVLFFHNRKISTYNASKDLLKYIPDAQNVQKLDYYFHKPADLEKVVFDSLHHNLNNTEEYSFDTSGNAPKILPKKPNLQRLFDEMDFLRKKHLSDIKGGESEKYFQDIEKEYNSIIDKYLKFSSAYFSAETKRLQKLNTEDISKNEKRTAAHSNFTDEFISENKDFFKSKEIFNRKLSSSISYKKNCISFLKLYSNIKGMKRDDIKILLNSKQRIIKNYISFILSLEQNILPASDILDYNYYRNLNSIYPLTSKLMKSSIQILSINNTFKPYLIPEDLNEFHEKKKDFIAFCNNSKKDILQIHIEFRKNYIAGIKEQKKNAELMRQRTAQYEINIIAENIILYSNALKKLNYSDELFREYQSEFKILHDDCANGIFSEDLDTVLKTGSLFSLITDYDKAKLQNEYKAKQYIKSVISRDTAGLKTLISHYKSRGIKFIDLPVYIDNSNVSYLLNKTSKAKIDDWLLTEKNFQNTDRKAVKLIKQIYYKKSWELTPSNREEEIQTATAPHKKYRLKNSDIIFMVPAGWDLVQPTSSEKLNGSISKFVNGADFSEIQIIFYDKNSDSPSAVAKWISSNSYKPVKIGWETIEGENFYWTVSKDDEMNVIKTYAVKTQTGMILISGKTDKKRFPFFQGRIESVFMSIISGV